MFRESSVSRSSFLVGLLLTAAMTGGCTAAKSASSPGLIETPPAGSTTTADAALSPASDEPVVANVLGNTPGNIVNVGFVAQQGSWLYYRGVQGGLWKARTDGTGREKLSDDWALWINVVGDWIYYIEESYYSGPICRVRTDGTDRSVLNPNTCEDLYVAGDWMYYQDQRDWGTYRARLDGSGEMLVSSENVSGMNVVDEWVYYYNDIDDPAGAYKVRADGAGQRTKLSEDEATGSLVVADGWVYYLTKYDFSLCRVRTDGTERTQLTDTETAPFFNVSGESVFYANRSDGDSLYVMKTDGSGQKRLDDISDYINVAGDWVYVLKYDGLYGIKSDGTGRRTLE